MKRVVMNRLYKHIALICLFLFGGCCTMKHCTQATELIQFAGFTPLELESVKYVSYQANGRFDIAIDSQVERFTGSFQPIQDTVGFLLRSELNLTRDYIFHFGNNGKQLRVSNIAYRDHGCNKCFPFGTSGSHLLLDFYKINGLEIFDRYLAMVWP